MAEHHPRKVSDQVRACPELGEEKRLMTLRGNMPVPLRWAMPCSQRPRPATAVGAGCQLWTGVVHPDAEEARRRGVPLSTDSRTARATADQKNYTWLRSMSCVGYGWR
jgi:hypothetical protein